MNLHNFYTYVLSNLLLVDKRRKFSKYFKINILQEVYLNSYLNDAKLILQRKTF